MTINGFTCGAFDLLHAGHMLMFAECKQHCGRLIVGLHVDPSLERPEKNKPVQTLQERYTVLQGVRYVDVIEVYETEADLMQMLMRSKVDIRFVGEDWQGKPITAAHLGIPLHYTKRYGYSSSELRQRVYRAEIDNRLERIKQEHIKRWVGR